MYSKAKTGDSSDRHVTDLMSLFLISHRYCQDLFESPNVCTGLQELENYIITVYFRLSFIGQNNTERALYKFTWITDSAAEQNTFVQER